MLMMARKLYAVVFLGLVSLVLVIFYNGRDRRTVRMDDSVLQQVEVEIHDVSEGATKKVELIMSKPDVEYIDEYPERPLQIHHVPTTTITPTTTTTTRPTTTTRTTTKPTTTKTTRDVRRYRQPRYGRPRDVVDSDRGDSWREAGHRRYYPDTDRTTQQVAKNCTRETPAKKIFLFTYMRGGSSLFGDIFNRDPRVMYWYEAADSFYMSHFGLPIWTFPQDIIYASDGSLRKIPQSENDALASYFDDLFNCRVSQLPVETLLHEGLDVSHSSNLYYRSVSYVVRRKCGQFLEMMCGDTVLQSIKNQCPEQISRAAKCLKETAGKAKLCLHQPDQFDQRVQQNGFLGLFEEHQKCLRAEQKLMTRHTPMLQTTCCNADIQVAKVHRLTMSSMEALIQKMPDLKILYYVRDPRGIAISRRNAPHEKGNLLWAGSPDEVMAKDAVTEAKLLCSRMLKDFDTVKKLQRKYPGSILMARYEDLIQNPYEVLDTVFSYLDEKVDDMSLHWLLGSMHAAQSGTAYQTTRVNATATANAWRDSITRRQKRQMNRYCGNILEQLGYTLDF